MSSLSSALNTANSALRFNQSALSVVANNVANTNTEGYTRQVISAQNQVIGGEGQGVSGTVIRYSDDKMQANINQQQSKVSYNNTVQEYFDVIENQFGKLDNASNLDKQFTDMFTQLNNLIADPTLSSNRVIFKNSTVQTTERLNTLSGDLKENLIGIDDKITEDLSSINIALKNISSLNKQIAQIERGNGNSSDLQDLRQKEINVIANNFDVNVEVKEDAQVNISLQSGKVLVDSTYVQFTRSATAPGDSFGGVGIQRVVSEDGRLANSIQVLNPEDLKAGSIGALVDLRDDKIPKMIEELDNFAVSLITEFNNIHAQGSAIPPPNELSSLQQPNAGATLLTDIGLQTGTDFDLSIVDASGTAVATTAQLPYTGNTSASTIPGTTTATFDPEAYLTANGATSNIEGTASVEYLGANNYRMIDPSGSIHLATLNPAAFPVAGVPAQLEFGNGVTLDVNVGTAQPAVGPVGTIDLNLVDGPIRIQPGDTIDDLAAKVNASPTLSAQVTATVVDGALVFTATNANNGVVLGNDPTGDTFNKLGFNQYFTGTDASSIKVTDAVINDLNNLATGRMGDNGGFTSTNNENAVALANLQNASFSFSAAGGLSAKEESLTDYLISITSTFAANSSANKQEAAFNQVLYDDFDSRLSSVAGVNVDEEFSNMIVYQRGFEASARIISTIDKMLETLINIV